MCLTTCHGQGCRARRQSSLRFMASTLTLLSPVLLSAPPPRPPPGPWAFPIPEGLALLGSRLVTSRPFAAGERLLFIPRRSILSKDSAQETALLPFLDPADGKLVIGQAGTGSNPGGGSRHRLKPWRRARRAIAAARVAAWPPLASSAHPPFTQRFLAPSCAAKGVDALGRAARCGDHRPTCGRAGHAAAS